MPFSLARLCKRVDISLSGSEKFEKVESPVFTGFCHTQEGQVFVDAFLRRRSRDYVAQPRERLDGVFGVG
jgi:hypothetical protein